MKSKSYTDFLAELYPEFHNTLEVGSGHAFNLTMQVTEACNLCCTYCYQHDKSAKRMSFETGKKFIDLILASDSRTDKYIKSRDCVGAVLDFIGGEPLLEIDLIDKLTDYFISQLIELDHPWQTRYKVSICTNGVLYFDERVQNYLRKNAGHLSLSITVDGNKKLHDQCRVHHDGTGSYDEAIAAAKDWEAKYHGKLGTKITIAPSNIEYLDEAFIEFLDLGETQIHANCVYEEGWTTEHASQLYTRLKRVADYLLDHDLQDTVEISILDDPCGKEYTETHTWCGGNGLMLAVDPSGDIYPCIRYTPSSMGNNQPPFVIGNVDKGIIVDDAQLRRLNCLKCITRASQVKGTKCESCHIATGCGDCAAYSYEVFGEVGHRTDYICDMHKARVLAQCYYRKKANAKTGVKDLLPMNCPKEWAVPIIGEEEYNRLMEV